MQELAIVPSGTIELPTLSVTPEFLARREDAIASAALIARVASPEENNRAVEVQKALVGLVREVESARKKLKEPVLDLGRRIDATAKAAVEPITAAELPLRNLISDFADSERKRAQAEAARIEAERRQAEEAALQARLAEEKRVREEAEVRLRAAKDAADKARIEQEAQAAVERAKAEQERAQRLADERAAMDRQMHAPAVAQGQSVRTEWQLDIVDIWALARAHPACVTITPRLSEIKALLDAGAKVVGVSAKRVTIAGVRTAGRTIDV